MRIASKVYAVAIVSRRALDLDLEEHLSKLRLYLLSLFNALYIRKEHKA
jgi:hypothetical protein